MTSSVRVLAMVVPAVAASFLLLGSAAAPAPHAAPAPSPTAPHTRSETVKEVLPSNVRIAVSIDGKPARSASGVIVASRSGPNPTSWVMTNAHVAGTEPKEQATIEVLVDHRAETSHYMAKVVALGAVPDMDLAVLEVPGLLGAPAHLADDADVELGDDVVVVGAPFGKGLSISSGIVSQVEWTSAGAPFAFKTDAPIGYGASGGGIYRVSDGKLLALVEGYRTAKVSFPVAKTSYSFDVPMPGETFAAPAAKIRSFIAEHGLSTLLTGNTAAR